MCMTIGDWYTANRSKRALAAKADGEGPGERCDGLICMMADFHTQLEVCS